MPLLEVGHGHVGWKARPIGVAHGAREAQEVEAMRAQERRDVGDRKLLLLHMKQQVTALAGGEEVGVLRHIVQRRAVLAADELLPATPDVIGALATAALGDEGA